MLLHPLAKVPTRSTSGSVGWDVHAVDDVTVECYGSAIIPLGLSIRPPEGTYIRIAERSSFAHRHPGLQLRAGVCDPDYTGELKCIVSYYGPGESFTVEPGDPIAQLIFEQVHTPEMEPVDPLPADGDRLDRAGFNRSPTPVDVSIPIRVLQSLENTMPGRRLHHNHYLAD